MFAFSRHRLDAGAFHELVGRSTVIEKDSFGEKVLRTPEGLMVKIFRRKRLLTSATLVPYARRFVRNTRLLSDRGIPTVTVVDYAHCPALNRHLVTYRPLPGITVRAALGNSVYAPALLLPAVSGFIADLHQKGVYFRSLHFGNIIVAPEGLDLGLIDVADMTIRSSPLSIHMRARNFRHMLRCREDAGFLRLFGGIQFIDSYLSAARLDSRSRQHFLEIVRRAPEWALPAQARSGG